MSTTQLTLQSKEVFAWQTRLYNHIGCDIIISNTGVRNVYALYFEGETTPRRTGTLEELITYDGTDSAVSTRDSLVPTRDETLGAYFARLDELTGGVSDAIITARAEMEALMEELGIEV